METLLAHHTSVIIPVVLALGVIVVLLKVLIAIEHAVVRIITSVLTILVLGALLLAGVSAFGRFTAIEHAAAKVTQSIASTPTRSDGTIAAADLQRSLDRVAATALPPLGLNPADLTLQVMCSGPGATLQLRYSDRTFLFGLWSGQEFTTPLPSNVRCTG